MGNDDKNDDSRVEDIMTPELPSVDSNYCCWGDECQFIGIPGPTLNECGHFGCVGCERFHHACMVCWVEKRDPNPECL